MAWLARLDRKAHTWPAPIRWLYQGAKWYLIAAGAIVLAVYWLQRIGVIAH